MARETASVLEGMGEELEADLEKAQQQITLLQQQQQQQAPAKAVAVAGDQLETLFKFYDADDSGELSLVEFKLACQLAIDDATLVESIFKRLDKDGDDSMSLAEFKQGFGFLKDKIRLQYVDPPSCDDIVIYVYIARGLMNHCWAF